MADCDIDLTGDSSEEDSLDDTEQHLSFFEDTELVSLILGSPTSDDASSPEPPTVEVESSPAENLDHVYHKQPRQQSPASPLSFVSTSSSMAVTEQLMLPLDTQRALSPDSAAAMSCPRSPFSCASSSSGYESDHTSDPISWNIDGDSVDFGDLFPELV